jgi:integrase
MIGKHMATKFKPGEEIVEAGFGELSTVSFIIGEDGDYCGIQNRYLRERATNRWAPPCQTVTDTAMTTLRRAMDVKRLRPLTNDAYADALTNFTTWIEDPDRHPDEKPTMETIAVSDLRRYAQQMESGEWAQDGAPLRKATIRLRGFVVLDCLQFATARKLRPALDFSDIEKVNPKKSNRRHTEDNTKPPSQFPGNFWGRRADPQYLILPTPRQLSAFMGCFSDPVHRIGSDLIIDGGLRISEACRIPETAMPTVQQALAKWGHLDVDVDFAIVGKGDKPRTPSIPGDLLRDIQIYRDSDRVTRLELNRLEEGKKDKPLLLLKRGTPLTPAALRKAWNLACAIAREQGHNLDGFTPHIGRHAYAVYWLLARIQEDGQKIGLLLRQLPADAVRTFGESHLITLQRKLGHALLQTTERYLALLPNLVRFGQTGIARQNFLDEEEEE